MPGLRLTDSAVRCLPGLTRNSVAIRDISFRRSIGNTCPLNPKRGSLAKSGCGGNLHFYHCSSNGAPSASAHIGRMEPPRRAVSIEDCAIEYQISSSYKNFLLRLKERIFCPRRQRIFAYHPKQLMCAWTDCASRVSHCRRSKDVERIS